MLLSASFPANAKKWAERGNTVLFDNTSITLFSPTSFMVKEGEHYTFPKTVPDLGITAIPAAPVKHSIRRNGESFIVSTDAIEIVVTPSKSIQEGRIGIKDLSTNITDRDTRNLGGMVGALDNCDGEECYSEQNDITSSHFHHPTPDNGLLSRRGYTVLRHTKDELAKYEPGDYFNELVVLCYGSDYRQAFRDFTAIAGKVPLFPKWSTGLVWSRWKDYTDKDYYNYMLGELKALPEKVSRVLENEEFLKNLAARDSAAAIYRWMPSSSICAGT